MLKLIKMETKVKQLQQNVDQVDNSESSSKKELIKREDVKDSPFTIISLDGYHFGVLGDYRITEKTNDKKKLRQDLKKFTWNRLIQVMMILENQREKISQEVKLNTEKV